MRAKTKKIPLTRGRFALVDEQDYFYLMAFRWHCTAKGYAARMDGRKIVLMHREIARPSEGFDVDHRDGNRLNNRRENLRRCTHAQNTWNHRVSTRNKSGFTGILFRKKSRRWEAHIGVNNKFIYLGRFATKKEAIRARQRAVQSHHGQFAPKKARKGK